MIKFKLFEDFLSKDENMTLLQLGTELEDWNDSTVISEGIKDWRKSKTASLSEENVSLLMDKIKPMFPDLHNEFYGNEKKISDIEIQLTRSHDGDFYKPHPDTGEEDFYRNRKLTFVYYMHKIPKQFINGNIRIYDEPNKPELGRQYNKNKYLEFEPNNNTLLLFPSYQWHEVKPVRCALDWTYSRFTINGWIH